VFVRGLPRRVVVAATVMMAPLAAIPIMEPAGAQAPTLHTASTPTYQTNGRVAAILVVGNTVYIGGDFTAVRPPGAAPGSREVPRAHVAAFRVDTGKLRRWNPHANGSVTALAASARRHSIYIGGSFTRLAGAHRHNLGAVNAKTGSVTHFHANTGGSVLALATSRTRLYVGGDFDAVKHKPRHHVAAVTLRGRLVRSWHPRANSLVRSIRVAEHGKRVYLGGLFSKINGHNGQFLAKVSASGRLLPWHKHPGYPVWSLVVGSRRVFAGGNALGGHVSAFNHRGRRAWSVDADGGVQSLASFHGSIIAGGHFRNICTGMTGRHCTTVAAIRNKLVSLDAGTGAVNAWNPSANSGLGVFALARAGLKLYVGGVFTKVNGVPQQGFDSFRS
jgi:outer membrane protein assembly factor BamB